MTPYFPLFLSLEGRGIVVIGGGIIAARRIEKLLPFQPNITRVFLPSYTQACYCWQSRRKLHGNVGSIVPGIAPEPFSFWLLPMTHRSTRGQGKKRGMPEFYAIEQIVGKIATFIFPAWYRQTSWWWVLPEMAQITAW